MQTPLYKQTTKEALAASDAHNALPPTHMLLS
jgi:hypothetical protein